MKRLSIIAWYPLSCKIPNQSEMVDREALSPRWCFNLSFEFRHVDVGVGYRRLSFSRIPLNVINKQRKPFIRLIGLCKKEREAIFSLAVRFLTKQPVLWVDQTPFTIFSLKIQDCALREHPRAMCSTRLSYFETSLLY